MMSAREDSGVSLLGFVVRWRFRCVFNVGFEFERNEIVLCEVDMKIS